MFKKFCELIVRLFKAREYFDTHENVNQKLLDELYKLLDEIDETYALLPNEKKETALQMIIGVFA